MTTVSASQVVLVVISEVTVIDEAEMCNTENRIIIKILVDFILAPFYLSSPFRQTPVYKF